VGTVTGQWLLVRYGRCYSAEPISLAVVLYVPGYEDLHMAFADITENIADSLDRFILLHFDSELRRLAREQGPSRTFDWMHNTLSNQIFVEGPYDVAVGDPSRTILEIAKQCNIDVDLDLPANLRQPVKAQQSSNEECESSNYLDGSSRGK
jgi:hypothetical protein